jgi:MFS family permease
VSTRFAGRLAWGLAATSALLFAAGLALYAAGTGAPAGRVLSFLIILGFSGVGALVASRQPRNAIGWIFCGAALLGGALGTLGDAYAWYWLDGHGASEGLAKAGASYATVNWIPGVLVPIVFLLLLFPDGRLLTRRWRAVAWCAALGIAGAFVTTALKPGALEDFPQIQNPLGIHSGLRDALEGLSVLLLLVGLVGASVSMFLRMRRASGQQREQIKWLGWAGALAVVTFVIGVAGYDVWGEAISNAAILLGVLGLAVATAIAILRYRLYDIDVVINRTLVYAVLTATLAGAYLASVLLLQLLLSPSSDFAIAGSTLAVAALFRPARSRIQEAVDRRFYRRRYDAARTLERFGVRLRDEVDLDSLGGELRGVVADTMQPAHVSLWLREVSR